MILPWCLLPLSLRGEDCPTVEQALKTLHEATDGGVSLHARIESGCPGHLDTLSLLYHQRTVYAFNAGQPWAVTIGYALKTLEVQQQLYAGREALPLGKTLANLGFAYRRSGQPLLALPYLKEADAVFKMLEARAEDQPAELAGIRGRRTRNRLQLIYAWQAMGDYGQAKSLLPVMLARARAGAAPAGLAEVLRLWGVQANGTEAYAAALPWLEEAVTLFAESGGVRGEVESRLEMARSLFYLGRYEAAEQEAHRALAVAGDYPLTRDKAVLQNQLALIHNKRRRFTDARDAIARGLEIIADGDHTQLRVLLLGNLARIAATAGQPQEALQRNAEAIALLVPGWRYSEETILPGSDQLAATNLKVDLFQLLGERLEYMEAAGAAAGAMEVARAADAVADLLRSDFSGQVSKLFWRREALPVYEAGIRLSHAASDADAAFYFLEKSRAVLLLEGLLETAARARIDAGLAGELSRVSEELRVARRNLLVNQEVTDDRQRLIGLSDTLGRLREELATRYPRIGALLRSPRITTIDEARTNFTTGGWDRQVHFFQGEERSYAFELSATSARTIDLGSTDRLEAGTRKLLAYFAGPTVIENDPSGFLDVSYQVYHQLFSRLETLPDERLLLLPGGLLSYLPFNALVTAPGGKDPATAPYLIRRNELSYAQSATVLTRQMGETEKKAGTAFAFSPFYKVLAGNNAPALPFSEVEVGSLAGHYTTTRVEGAAANREALLSGMAGHAIIHLSTHAYATPDGTEQPHILTATEAVYLPDLQGLDLSAGLVTLSACQSNIGPLAKGEGALGLGRAFTAAGARGVVASLWSLNDRATADVVTTFYQALAEGMPKPSALHRAQLSYLERTDVPAYLKSPYYWAGLVYYGDGGSLLAGGRGWLLPGLVLTCLGLVGVWGLRRR